MIYYIIRNSQLVMRNRGLTMKYIIIPIIILFILFLVGLMIRRKTNGIIGRIEKEKVEIQHYPIFEELTKIKALNMNGQTEELFERWRSQWTEVVDVHIIEIDNMLFDAEELVDRFKFKKASALTNEIEEKLKHCENIKNTIISELQELIGSEEKNRVEMEKLKENYRASRKNLLAHQPSFGQALPLLEKELEEFKPEFEKFDELTESGNYLEARELVLTLDEKSKRLNFLINEVPILLTELQTKIPSIVHDLRNGKNEMEEQSYYLGHLELGEYLDKVEKELEDLKEQLSNLKVEEVSTRVKEINTEFDQYYQLLEKEVVAKNYVEKNTDDTRETLLNAMESAKEVNDEATYVQNSYQLPEDEAEIPKDGLKQLEIIQKRFEQLCTQVDGKSAYSSLQEELEDIREKINQIIEDQEQFSSRLKNLRVDETNARTKLEKLKKILQDTDRRLNKANIPGIPEDMDARLEEAEEQLFFVVQSLQETPLNMKKVFSNLEKAEGSIESVQKHAEEMIENVILIERTIQYGNRYRAFNPQVDELLTEAEEAFHRFQYLKALEDAVNAVEMAEPGAIKVIEQLVQEELYSKS